MIKKIIPEMQFQAGTGGFKVPKGYYFVRRLVNQYASEYYLFPFHWLARIYWRIIYFSTNKLGQFVRKMHRKGWFTIDTESAGMLTWWELFKYIWRNRTYAKKKKKAKINRK